MSFYRKYLHSYRWFVYAIFLFALLGVLSFFPEFVWKYYSGLAFGLFRKVVDIPLNFLPFSAFWIFLIALFSSLFGAIRARSIKSISWWLNSVGLLICSFYILWGFNYKAMSVEEKLGLHPQQMDIETLDINSLTALIDSTSLEDLNQMSEREMKKALRNAVHDQLEELELHHSGKPIVRYVPSGFLRRMGIYGIYLPYTFEAYVDASLRNSQKCFTTGHELCHSYGITSEAEANFIALISMLESEDQRLRSSALMTLLKSRLYRLKYEAEEDFERIFNALPEWLKQEYIAQDKENEKYRSWLWKASEMSNDAYLKMQGQEDGIDSYANYLQLYLSYRNEYPSASLP